MAIRSPVGIRYLSGTRLRRAVVAGAHRVIASADLLDRINVFPVPDADTGQNLSATLWAVLHGLRGCRGTGVGEVAKVLAQSALRGARGNSGVILAQFFQGLAEGLGGQARVELGGFSRALSRAALRARQALAEPQEGTILSAISAFAHRVEELAARLGDFVPTLREGLAAARQALRESRELLPSLREAGVVDAGALGFVRFLEGIVHYITTGEMDELSRTMPEPQPERVRVKYEPASISFRYCTECTLAGPHLPAEEVKRAWGELGDSVVVAGDRELLHLHVHTNVPARALEIAAQFGQVQSSKVDDMWAQHAEAFGEPKTGAIALVVDTSCDLPDRIMTRHRIHIVPLRVRVGGREYRDRVELTPQEFYRLMRGEPQVGTSQPPPADFLETYRHLGRTFSQILALVLAKDLSGTWNSAHLASQELSQPGLEVKVVDSGTLSGGLGLVAWAAALGIEAGLSLPQVAELARAAAREVKFFGGLPNLEPLGRSGRVPWVAGWLSGRLRLGMVISVGGGHIRPVAPGWGARQLLGKVAALARETISRMGKPLVLIPHAAAAGVAEALAGRVAEAAPGPDAEIYIVDASPALGVHAGLGAFGVALLDRDRIEQEIRRLEGET